MPVQAAKKTIPLRPAGSNRALTDSSKPRQAASNPPTATSSAVPPKGVSGGKTTAAATAQSGKTTTTQGAKAVTDPLLKKLADYRANMKIRLAKTRPHKPAELKIAAKGFWLPAVKK
jgi:hypothetical protein